MKRILFLLVLTMVAVSAASYQNEGTTLSSNVAPKGTAPTTKNDESGLVTLSGNTRPEANPANDRGAAPGNFRLEHMMLLLRRTPQQERALEQLIDQLHNPKSPNFHHWLTAQQIGERYGLAQEDIAMVTSWLQSHGFEVNIVYSNRLLIDFSGTAAQVNEAFHTEIHYLEVNGEEHFANMSDPQIPAGLAQVVVGVVSLHNFRPEPMIQRRTSNLTYTGPCGPLGLSPCYALVPEDLVNIYSINPLFGAGVSGQGQTIALVEDTDVYSAADWTTFRSTFGLSGFTMGSFTTIHPGSNCTDPGAVVGADDEATLDAQWASTAAPNAAILMVSCADGGTYSTFGWFIALQNILSGTPPAIVSMSYGVSEDVLGATANAAINTTYQQAVTQGVSVFVSAGDAAADNNDRNKEVAQHGINISGFTTTPYNVAVGGTDFGDTFAGTSGTYWSSSNDSIYGSALSYIPEIPWNDTCGSLLLNNYLGYAVPYGTGSLCNSGDAGSTLTVAGGTGGPSGCAYGAPSVTEVVSGTCQGYAKPSWQQGIVGNPNDGVRDVPDVSLFAADGLWGHAYVFCFSDTSNGGHTCTGDPSGWNLAGGTSFAAPIMAGIQALANQATGASWGNPNYAYYGLARGEYGAGGNAACNSTLGNGVGADCIFYDVTQGDNDVPCYYLTTTTIYNCFDPGATSSNDVVGVLSTSNAAYHPAYGTKVGWDFATGIGTVNAYNLVAAFTNLVPNVSLSPPHLAFPIQIVHTASTVESLTLSNTGEATLFITGLSISGDFSQTNTCGSSVVSGAICQIKVTFTPSATGPRKSMISISDNAGGSPQQIYLTGVGTAANLSPPSLSFGSQTHGTSSGSKTITLKNAGSATMHLWQIAIGGTNPGDFSKTTTCGGTLGAGLSCTVSVTFKPTTTGARSASVLFSDDGGGSPQAIPMTGTGT